MPPESGINNALTINTLKSHLLVLKKQVVPLKGSIVGLKGTSPSFKTNDAFCYMLILKG